jgi:hypothetical protein
MTTRFDSDEYLADFLRRGRFPAIHDALFGLVVDRLRGSRVLDLCCSTGLFGERLRRHGVVEFVMGVDGDTSAIHRGQQAGVRIRTEFLRVGHGTLPFLAHIIRSNGITAVVARRCLPELLGDDPSLDGPFADTLADAGVAELFLEGRVVSPRSTNRLKSLDEEIAAVSGRFTPFAHRKALCYLRAEPISRTASAGPGAASGPS